MLAAKTENDALFGTLSFQAMHYALRPWPWIVVALASTIVYPTLHDIHARFPNVQPNLLGNDIAYPAMLVFLAGRFCGLHGRGTLRRVSLDDRNASELGHVVSRARLLSALLTSAATQRKALRVRRDVSSPSLLMGAGVVFHVRTRHGEGRVQSAAVDRRRNGLDLSAALVLVADQRVERSERDGRVVRRLAGIFHRREDWDIGCDPTTVLLTTVGVTTVVWLVRHVPHAAGRRATLADGILREGPAGRAGLVRIRRRGRAAAVARLAGQSLLGWVLGLAARLRRALSRPGGSSTDGRWAAAFGRR